mgnify:CR=1 FL=1
MKPAPDIAKLKQALIKAALIQYEKWLVANAEPKPWGHPQGAKTKAAHNLIMATKALYDAIKQARAGKGRK